MSQTLTDDLYLALDQGGHSSRALVADSTGTVIAQAQVSVSTHRDGENVEQDPQELADSLKQCCQAVSEQLGDKRFRIVRAGLATQRSSIVCWDRKSGTPISSVLSWQDRRAWQFVDTLKENADRIKKMTGLVLSPHYGASKLRWCLTELDAVKIAQKNDRLVAGPLASFLARQLTGSQENVCDPANASRTQLWDFNTRSWSEDLCDLFEVESGVLPKSVPTKYHYGDVLIDDHAVPLEVVTGDQSAAIYAFGQPNLDTLYINIGTGAFLQWPSGDVPRKAEGMLKSVVFQDESRTEYVLEGTVNGASSALTWLGKKHGREPEPMLNEGLAQIENAAPPFFINGISGLGSPYWISDLESCFSEQASEGLQAIAVVESVGFLICENLNVMRAQNQPIKKIVLSGGLASFDYLCQVIADISELEVARSLVKEATALGVIRLLANQTSSISEPSAQRFEPKANAGLRYRYQSWQEEMARLIKERQLP